MASDAGEFLLDETEWPAALADAPRALLRRIVAGIRRNPGLVGLAAGGSFRSGRMDDFSDLDLVVGGGAGRRRGGPGESRGARRRARSPSRVVHGRARRRAPSPRLPFRPAARPRRP